MIPKALKCVYNDRHDKHDRFTHMRFSGKNEEVLKRKNKAFFFVITVL